MNRAVLLVVALLLIPATVIASDGVPAQQASPNASRGSGIALLTLDGSSRATITNGSLEVGTALSVTRASTAIRLERYAFDARLRRTNDTDAVLDAAITRIDDNAERLYRRGERRWGKYANGSIDTTTLLRGLATTKARASSFAEWYERIDRIRDVFLSHPTLTALDGRVRSEIVDAIRGESSGRVYVAATPEGIVLATIIDGTYVRETYRPDRQSRPPEKLAASRAFDLSGSLVERYGLGDINVRPAIRGLNRNTFYRYEFDFETGSITAYLDGGTERIFYEVQTRNLDRFDGGEGITATANGTSVLINRSFPGGPLRIAIIDDGTGVHVPGTAIVNGHRIRTGPDGVVWTLTPPKRVFNVTAIGPAGRVTVLVSPTDPVALDDG